MLLTPLHKTGNFLKIYIPACIYMLVLQRISGNFVETAHIPMRGHRSFYIKMQNVLEQQNSYETIHIVGHLKKLSSPSLVLTGNHGTMVMFELTEQMQHLIRFPLAVLL